MSLAIMLILFLVVPYIGTWIETKLRNMIKLRKEVVPYIGTWIETQAGLATCFGNRSYLI